jgi:hypothetical protein
MDEDNIKPVKTSTSTGRRTEMTTKTKRPARAGDRTASGHVVVRWEVRHEFNDPRYVGPVRSPQYDVRADAVARHHRDVARGLNRVRIVRITRPDWRARAREAEALLRHFLRAYDRRNERGPRVTIDDVADAARALLARKGGT